MSIKFILRFAFCVLRYFRPGLMTAGRTNFGLLKLYNSNIMHRMLIVTGFQNWSFLLSLPPVDCHTKRKTQNKLDRHHIRMIICRYYNPYSLNPCSHPSLPSAMKSCMVVLSWSALHWCLWESEWSWKKICPPALRTFCYEVMYSSIELIRPPLVLLILWPQSKLFAQIFTNHWCLRQSEWSWK